MRDRLTKEGDGGLPHAQGEEEEVLAC
jgi:hypothetical protein